MNSTVSSILLALILISLLACFLLCKEFEKISSKRAMLLAQFDVKQPGTKRPKITLTAMYIVLTLILSLGLGFVLQNAI